MARSSNNTGATDTASAAQKRFVISLPQEIGDMLDEVGANLAVALEAQTGVAFELSRAQIVQALIRQALTASERTSEPEGAPEPEPQPAAA